MYFIEANAHIPKPASDYLKREEFGQIITSYLGESVDQTECIKIEAVEEPKIERIYENDIKTNLKKKHYTLDEIKNSPKQELFSWYTPQNLTTNEKNVNVAEVEADLQERTSVISRKEVSKFIDTFNDYPLAIKIPKTAWKKGYMYRVKDCFYDDNGIFLYRVPGLIMDENKQNNQ